MLKRSTDLSPRDLSLSLRVSSYCHINQSDEPQKVPSASSLLFRLLRPGPSGRPSQAQEPHLYRPVYPAAPPPLRSPPSLDPWEHTTPLIHHASLQTAVTRHPPTPSSLRRSLHLHRLSPPSHNHSFRSRLHALALLGRHPRLSPRQTRHSPSRAQHPHARPLG